MAITHADLAPGPRSTELGSKTGTSVMILSILVGLMSFVLCLVAETTRSEVTWALNVKDGRKGGESYECVYSGSGKIPLLCGVGAFLGLAIAVIVQYAYLIIAVSRSTPPPLIAWDPDSRSSKSIACQAGVLFLTTWVCFAVGEVLLLIGLSVESGHLKKWWRPRPSCLIVGPGLYSAAGVFGLTTVFLASGLYLTALRALKMRQEEDNVRHEVLNTSILFGSPPRSPPHRITDHPRVWQQDTDRQLPSPGTGTGTGTATVDPPSFASLLPADLRPPSSDKSIF
ncbi:uncharacterized protein LOC122078582 [Macadamia integrifolia]|uniref:uncharacterized protein LOC122078582 n=1 Tax=Macadamia integrifolia TaxID=60698 RepID=UPI001C4F5550|nr:uncharacterized protein LOC122078582 [Macadamia integrifolia]